MRTTTFNLSRLLLAASLGASAFAGDTGFDAQLKLRMGYGLESQDNLTRRNLGMGVDFGYTSAAGRLSAEIGFQYKPGDQFVYDYTKAPMIPGTVLMPAYSGDLRRNSMQGITLRLGYGAELNEDWGIRVGVQMFGTGFRHEYIANVAYNPGAVTDSYNGVITKSSAALSPFLGASYRLNENSSLEFGVIGLGYKAISYVHVSGTGTADGQNNLMDRVEETDRMVPHLEVAYVFRF